MGTDSEECFSVVNAVTAHTERTAVRYAIGVSMSRQIMSETILIIRIQVTTAAADYLNQELLSLCRSNDWWEMDDVETKKGRKDGRKQRPLSFKVRRGFTFLVSDYSVKVPN